MNPTRTQAERVIYAAEADLGALTDGERIDLLAALVDLLRAQGRARGVDESLRAQGRARAFTGGDA